MSRLFCFYPRTFIMLHPLLSPDILNSIFIRFYQHSFSPSVEIQALFHRDFSICVENLNKFVVFITRELNEGVPCWENVNLKPVWDGGFCMPFFREFSFSLTEGRKKSSQFINPTTACEAVKETQSLSHFLYRVYTQVLLKVILLLFLQCRFSVSALFDACCATMG